MNQIFYPVLLNTGKLSCFWLLVTQKYKVDYFMIAGTKKQILKHFVRDTDQSEMPAEGEYHFCHAK